MTRPGRDTDQDWKRIAEDDPYWGVLSQEDYRRGAMDSERLRQFMASGEKFVTDFLSFVRKYLSPDFQPRRALDVGCGVGRLAIPLAKCSGAVVGVDVAKAMLDICGKQAKLAGVSNLELVESDDSLSRVQGSFDLVNTYIVLQHIPPERGYRLIDAMLSRLEVGGIASIQVTYAKARQFMVHEGPKALYYRRDGNTLVDLVDSGWNPPEGTINMYDYDLNQVMAQVTRWAGLPVLSLPTNDDNHLGCHFVFAKARG